MDRLAWEHRLAKFAALLIFALLPFVGFYLGVRYYEAVTIGQTLNVQVWQNHFSSPRLQGLLGIRTGSGGVENDVENTGVTGGVAPSDRSSCEVSGGEWGKFGELDEDRCNLPTSDGGRACSDQFECEGACIAHLTDADRLALSEGVLASLRGQCTSRKLNFGCFDFVVNGQALPLCVD